MGDGERLCVRPKERCWWWGGRWAQAGRAPRRGRQRWGRTKEFRSWCFFSLSCCPVGRRQRRKANISKQTRERERGRREKETDHRHRYEGRQRQGIITKGGGACAGPVREGRRPGALHSRLVVEERVTRWRGKARARARTPPQQPPPRKGKGGAAGKAAGRVMARKGTDSAERVGKKRREREKEGRK